MHSRLPKAGTAAGLVVGLVASSLFIAPPSSAEEPTTPGNNLSFPVLWSEAAPYALEPPGDMGETSIGSGDDLAPCSEDTTVQAAVQKNENNLWQAENLVAEGNSVTSLDWGDNLEVKDWSVGPPVRIETALYAALDEQMTGYEMCHVSGKGTDEVWGAVVTPGGGMEMTEASTEEPATEEPATEEPATEEPGAEAQEPGAGGLSLTEYLSDEAMVYTAGARLTIQRIDDGANPTWDATQHRWVGQGVADPVFNRAIHEETGDGPGTYGAEINVSGKVVFGFNWQTDGLYNGEYRITFSLDGESGSFPGSGTSLANAEIRESVEETAGDELAIRSVPLAEHGGGMGGGGGHGGGGMGGGGMGGGGGEGEGNTAVMVGALDLSYIDVGITGGEDPPVTPDPEPTTPPAGGGGTSGAVTAPAAGTPADPSVGGGGDAAGTDSGSPVTVEPASPVVAQERIRQRALIKAPKSSKQRVRTRLMLTEEPIYTDQGVTIRWRVTKRSQDNCTIRNRDGEISVKFTKRGRCTVVAWAPSPNPLVYTPFKETRIYKVRNNL